jgi:glutamate-1-semialdehyde 2,1-aminomutase
MILPTIRSCKELKNRGDVVKRSKLLEQYGNLSPASREWYERAQRLFPNGVTHDSRFLQPYPLYIERAQDSHKYDLEGREYIDYWSGHGALILGHNPEPVVDEVRKQIGRGTHLGACHTLEVKWAELVASLVPSAERVRFTGSGTEATMMAVRLARTYTGKKKILKFAGHFHGWHDQVISGVHQPFHTPTPGILPDVFDTTIICPPNDMPALEKALKKDADIACIIIEPTGASFGRIPTDETFLLPLREAADRYDIVLIFDEVISGFRVAPGGAQSYYDVKPDLTALAKILAGGYPGGAVVGSEEIMELLEIRDDSLWMDKKKMPHPGTFNANPVSATAGIATLKRVSTGEPPRIANAMAQRLREGMNAVIDAMGLNWCVYGSFSEFRFLIDHDLGDIRAADIDLRDLHFSKLKNDADESISRAFRCGMLVHGIDIPPHGGLTMASHTVQDIDRTIHAFEKTLHAMRQDGFI